MAESFDQLKALLAEQDIERRLMAKGELDKHIKNEDILFDDVIDLLKNVQKMSKQRLNQRTPLTSIHRKQYNDINKAINHLVALLKAHLDSYD